MFPTVVTELLLSSFQFSVMAVFAFCGHSLLSVLLVGQDWASLGLRWGTGQKCSITKLQCTFPVLSSVKLSLVWQSALRPNNLHWGCSGTCLCDYTPFSLGQESLWSGTGPCQVWLHITRLVALLWVGSGQGQVGAGQHGNRAHGVSKICNDLLWGRTAIKAWLEGLCP